REPMRIPHRYHRWRCGRPTLAAIPTSLFWGVWTSGPDKNPTLAHWKPTPGRGSTPGRHRHRVHRADHRKTADGCTYGTDVPERLGMSPMRGYGVLWVPEARRVGHRPRSTGRWRD